LENCEGLVSPSFDEGYGLPVLEALSFGKKVFLSDIPIYKELFPQGIFASPNNPAQWLTNLTNGHLDVNPQGIPQVSWDFVAKEIRLIASELI